MLSKRVALQSYEPNVTSLAISALTGFWGSAHGHSALLYSFTLMTLIVLLSKLILKPGEGEYPYFSVPAIQWLLNDALLFPAEDLSRLSALKYCWL
ncbi:MAG: hypothetical protein NZ930_04910 [Candidatus Bipolaricaulota bacterium]|nr:hypothetical protein [Candidatus Bipolaricaulota bacterium]MDW8030368.1 hypothetical protein [Candidatus Bipolaricaulota bacterium]